LNSVDGVTTPLNGNATAGGGHRPSSSSSSSRSSSTAADIDRPSKPNNINNSISIVSNEQQMESSQAYEKLLLFLFIASLAALVLVFYSFPSLERYDIAITSAVSKLDDISVG
jgi:hypothetical protein